MSRRNYKVKLDTARVKTNTDLLFYISDMQSDRFTIKITEKGQVLDLSNYACAMIGISPSNKVAVQYITEQESNILTIVLQRHMMNEVGQWKGRIILFNEEQTLVLDTFGYIVQQDELAQIDTNVQDDDRTPILTDLINQCRAIIEVEAARVITEQSRVEAEMQRVNQEQARVEAEQQRANEYKEITTNLSGMQQEFDDFIIQCQNSIAEAINRINSTDEQVKTNEQERQQAENIRQSNEEERINNELNRQQVEAERVSAEQERSNNYSIIVEAEEERKQQAIQHQQAEQERVQAENQRHTAEQTRVLNEEQRVQNEQVRQQKDQVRQANEVIRQQQEEQRQSNETNRQSNVNALIVDAQAKVDTFDAYTVNAIEQEEERKANELDRKSQEDRRVSNENERISNENTRKANEVVREENETSRQDVFENKVNEVDTKISELNTTKDNFVSSVNTKVDNKISELDSAKSDMTTTVTNKVNEVEGRFNALTASQQQSSEVIDARDGETSLKARLDRDIEKAKQVYVNVKGSNISTDSSSGYAKDVEILGNTIQDASNLADIRSVGDKVEGQELYEIPVVSCGKNLFDGELELGGIFASTGKDDNSAHSWRRTSFIRFEGANLTHSLDDVGNKYLFEYDNKFNFIRYTSTPDKTHTFNISSETKYVKITYNFIPTKDIQLEEGTVATPYEPYQEEKLTILSPVQLEKVGNIADRIIEKDGVWGVEKNVKTMYTKEFASLIGTYEDKGDTHKWGLNLDTPRTFLLTNFLQTGTLSTEPTQTQVMLYNHNTYREFRITFKKSDFPNFDVKSNVVDYLSNETRFVKVVQDAQFIPLPHDQQVKLRTFANKTNISFLTEIEGTIKAQVPKSLGATVNTHTEQINNLNKELGRVKKLEESTVSTVTTESDFTTVEATSNGYFEDVKLEGKTLVNLSTVKNGSFEFMTGSPSKGIDIPLLKTVSGKITLIVNLKSNTLDRNVKISLRTTTNEYIYPSGIPQGSLGNLVLSYNTVKNDIVCEITRLRIYTDNTTSGSVEIDNIIVLEGDHTQNPPSYFEGLKSVGEDADEIVVSSNNNQPKQIKTTDDNSITTTIDNPNYQSDKKRLLYYNEETQVWEKPILREWDSIEKHSDGKYYYHQRSGEVVLNGSEDWSIVLLELDNTHRLGTDKLINCMKPSCTVICDKFTQQTDNQQYNNDIEGISTNASSNLYIRISKSKLSTQDVQGFKQWLQANNVTVVYQLAQEKVYECTNIDLITYANETNYIVESGAIVPKTTLKVLQNAANIIRQLQQKVSVLEQNESKFMQILLDLINK